MTSGSVSGSAGPRTRNAHHQRDARGEHDEVDDGVGGERERDVRAGQRRRHRIGGAQEPVDRPGLAADLGRRPAREDGEKAERRGERAERGGTSARRTASSLKRSHQLMTTASIMRPQTADHDAEAEERDGDRQRGPRRESPSGPAPSRSRSWVRMRLPSVRDRNLVMVRRGRVVGNGEHDSAGARLPVFQIASIAASLAG